jgi:hypothetical protein
MDVFSDKCRRTCDLVRHRLSKKNVARSPWNLISKPKFIRKSATQQKRRPQMLAEEKSIAPSPGDWHRAGQGHFLTAPWQR